MRGVGGRRAAGRTRRNGPGFRRFSPDMLTGTGAFRVDLSVRPVKVSLSPARSKLVALLAAFALFVAMAAGVASLDPQRASGPVFLFFALLFFAPVGVLAVVAFATRRSAVFDHAHVRVTEPNRTRWRADYREFLGIRYRILTRDFGEGSSSFLVIELVHPDDAKTLPLFVDIRGMGSDERRRELETFARQLKLPVLKSPDDDDEDDDDGDDKYDDEDQRAPS